MRTESIELEQLGESLLTADDSETSKIAAICASLGISYEEFELAENKHSFDRNLLLRAWDSEQGVGRFSNWMQLDYSLERLLHAVFLQRKVLGRGVPLEDRAQLRKAFAILGFTQGLNFVLARSLHTCVLVLLGYQIYSGKTYNPVTMYREADAIAVTDISHALLDKDASRILYSVLASLCAWAVVKSATYAYLTPADPDKAVADALAAIKAVPNTQFYNWSRWLLPRPPLDRPINLLERLIVWDARLSDASRLAAFEGLKEIIETRSGYSVTAALHAVAKVANGLSLRQFDLADEAKKPDFLAIKLSAMSLIQNQKAAMVKALKQPFRKMYAAYLFWALGLSESKAQRLGFLGFKLTKLALIALFMKSLIEGYIDFRNCPDKPYSFATGAPAFAGDFSQSCFDATISSFGKYPGQDVSYLTNLIKDFKGRLNNPLQLDLSGKSLYGTEIAQIVRALQDLGIEIDELNISGNILNEPRDIEALMPLLRGAKRFYASSCNIGQETAAGEDSSLNFGGHLPELIHLEELDISYNQIGDQRTNGTLIVAAGFKNLNKLKKLNFSNNNLGNYGQIHNVALGEIFRFPSSVEHLDLSYLNLGAFGGSDVAPVVESFSELTQLRYLDFSGNSLEDPSQNSPAMLGKSLKSLTSLEVLILASCQICNRPTSDFFPLIDSLGRLVALRHLDLSGNCFGQENLTLRLSKVLKNLKNLEVFKISGNSLGHNSTVSVENLGQALAKLTNLRYFDASSNSLGKMGPQGVDAIVRAFKKLSRLTYVSLDVNFLSFNATRSANLALQFSGSSARVRANIVTAQDVQDFFLSISQNVTRLDLPKVLEEAYPEALEEFAIQLSRQTQLIHLDLSSSGFNALAINATNSLIDSIGFLNNLKFLKLSNNPCGESFFYNPFINSLRNLQNLEELDLSDTGAGGGYGTGMDGDFFYALGSLRKLRKLNLAGNFLGFRDGDIENFSNSLQQLTNLEYLNISRAQLAHQDQDSYKTGVLFSALHQLTRLSILDLSQNGFGKYGPSDAQIISGYLNQTNAMRYLDLGLTCLGFNQTGGMSLLFEAIPSLTNLTFLRVPNTLRGVNWTSNVEAFAARTTQGLQEKCQAELCFSSDVRPNAVPLDLAFTDVYPRCYLRAIKTSPDQENLAKDFNFLIGGQARWSATQPELIPLFMLVMLCVYAFKKISGCFVARSEEPQRGVFSHLRAVQ